MKNDYFFCCVNELFLGRQLLNRTSDTIGFENNGIKYPGIRYLESNWRRVGARHDLNLKDIYVKITNPKEKLSRALFCFFRANYTIFRIQATSMKRIKKNICWSQWCADGTNNSGSRSEVKFWIRCVRPTKTDHARTKSSKARVNSGACLTKQRKNDWGHVSS